MSSEKRLSNFTQREVEVLVNLIEKYGDIIESKGSDSNIWKKKRDAWQKILDKFQTETGVKRSIGNIKLKYGILKENAKKEISDERKEMYLTGGGNSKQKISPISERIAALLGISGTGLINPFDKDALESPGT